MLYDVTSDQSNLPVKKNPEGDRFPYETVHASDAQYVEYQCMNCGEPYQAGELVCTSCGLMFSNKGKTEQLDTKRAAEPTRTRRVGELVADAHRSIIFKVASHALTIPVADVVIVGRSNGESLDQQPDVDLTPFKAKELGISRQHLRLTRTRDLVRAADLGSLNGTYLNGFRLAPNQDRVLRDGDEMFMAQLRVTIQF